MPIEKMIHPIEVPAQWLACALDELDYGVLLCDVSGKVHHLNRAAASQLAHDHPLRFRDGTIELRSAANSRILNAALTAASRYAKRRMVALLHGRVRFNISVLPLAQSMEDGGTAAMLVFGRPAPCVSLSAHSFAAGCGLSDAETHVLGRLIDGEPPAGIAAAHRVALSTVRTQIGSIRAKTGADSMRSLIRELAMLPPLVSILGEPSLTSGG